MKCSIKRSRYFVPAAVAATMLGATLAFAPMPAYAVTQADLDAAREKLTSLYDQAEIANSALQETQASLDETNAQIEETNAQIEETQQQLADKRQLLSQRIVATYKSGGVSVINMILDSDNFDDLINSIYYAQKVSQQDADTIHSVEDLSAELEQKQQELADQKAAQETLLAQQTADKQALDAKVADAQAYYDGLDQEMKEQIAAAQKAEQEKAAAEAAAAVQQAQQQAAAAQAQQQQQQEQQQQQQNTNSGSNSSSSSNSSSNSSSSSNSGSSSNSSSSNVSGSWRSIVIAAASSKLGCSYVWGAGGPSSFDCSGFTSWCYAQAGISITHYSGGQSAFCSKPASQAQPGDVVYRRGHVGIYIGNGTTIEAIDVGSGVGYGSLSTFQTAGSPV